jgi:outer membrane murein-binding lipoprotein Lpp
MKTLPITENIKGRIKNAIGSDIDFESIAVFEAMAADLLPLSKPGSIYDKAQFSESTLNDMATWLQTPNNLVNLLCLHADGMELPSGRVFYGYIKDTKLYVQFYMPKSDDNAKLIDQGIVDAVSLGFKPKGLTCSTCGWDYLEEPSREVNLWERTCANGHTLGEDGCHLKIEGVDTLKEVSLVGRGAVSRSRLVTPTTANLSGNGDRLTSANLVERLSKVTVHSTEEVMTPEQFNEFKAKFDSLGEQVNQLNAKVTELSAVTAKAPKEPVPAPEVNASDADKAKEHLLVKANECLTNKGVSLKLDASTPVDQILAVLKDAETKVVVPALPEGNTATVAAQLSSTETEQYVFGLTPNSVKGG